MPDKTLRPELESILESLPANLRPKLPSQSEIARTTLKLGASTWTLVERISARYALTQREVIEQAIEVIAGMAQRSVEDGTPSVDLSHLLSVSSGAESDSAPDAGVRKTAALSNSSMRAIKYVMETAQRQNPTINLTRDSLVESALVTLEALLAMDEKEKPVREARAYEVINRCWEAMLKHEEEIKGILPDDDPILDEFGQAICMVMNISMDLESRQPNRKAT